MWKIGVASRGGRPIDKVLEAGSVTMADEPCQAVPGTGKAGRSNEQEAGVSFIVADGVVSAMGKNDSRRHRGVAPRPGGRHPVCGDDVKGRSAEEVPLCVGEKLALGHASSEAEMDHDL